MPTYTRLKAISDVSQSTLNDQLESNLIEFFNWGMLCVGAFGSAQLNQPGPYGGDMSRLRPVSDPNFTQGQVWEGVRQSWVWESGVEYGLQPISISGVYVNNVFYPWGTSGIYSHAYVSYPQGRIVFNTALPLNSIVQAEYSYKLYNFHPSDVVWFRQIMFDSFRVDNPQFLQYGSGVWDMLAAQRVQLPAVVVEVTPRRDLIGRQLGGGQWVYQDVVFHVYTENPSDRKFLMDAITYQKDKTIMLFDKNAIAQANAAPLDWNGALASGALCYPTLVLPSGNGGFWWNRGCTFTRMVGIDSISSPPLLQGTVRATAEVIMPEL